jgi:hypothetical protein
MRKFITRTMTSNAMLSITALLGMLVIGAFYYHG